jgi:hypothetical protein
VLSAHAAPALGPALLLRADSGSRKRHRVLPQPRGSWMSQPPCCVRLIHPRPNPTPPPPPPPPQTEPSCFLRPNSAVSHCCGARGDTCWAQPEVDVSASIMWRRWSSKIMRRVRSVPFQRARTAVDGPKPGSTRSSQKIRPWSCSCGRNIGQRKRSIMMACQMVKMVAQYQRTCTNQLGPHLHCVNESPGGCAQFNFPSD